MLPVGLAFPGYYHYHVIPGDSTPLHHSDSQNTEYAPLCDAVRAWPYNETSIEHSPIAGWMANGIPIYGPRGDDGAVPTDLDVCNGHTDATHAFYHYHLTT